jgi:hypothetical protein
MYCNFPNTSIELNFHFFSFRCWPQQRNECKRWNRSSLGKRRIQTQWSFDDPLNLHLSSRACAPFLFSRSVHASALHNAVLGFVSPSVYLVCLPSICRVWGLSSQRLELEQLRMYDYRTAAAFMCKRVSSHILLFQGFYLRSNHCKISSLQLGCDCDMLVSGCNWKNWAIQIPPKLCMCGIKPNSSGSTWDQNQKVSSFCLFSYCATSILLCICKELQVPMATVMLNTYKTGQMIKCNTLISDGDFFTVSSLPRHLLLVTKETHWEVHCWA